MTDTRTSIDHVTDPDRFQISVDGEVAGFAQYVDADGQRIFFHTVIDDAFGGQGLAGQVVSGALDRTREEGLSVVTVCPFVKGYVEKHPEYADLVVPVTPTHVELAEAQPDL